MARWSSPSVASSHSGSGARDTGHRNTTEKMAHVAAREGRNVWADGEAANYAGLGHYAVGREGAARGSPGVHNLVLEY